MFSNTKKVPGRVPFFYPLILRAARRNPRLIFAGVIAALAGIVYLPFLGNPLVFDDLVFFSGAGFADYASTPFSGSLRNLPYFSLAFTQIMWGQFPPWYHAEIHRIGNLALHIACALVLYKLLYDLLRATEATPGVGSPQETRAHAHGLAFIGAAFFVIHPVAVYGAAYLVQRTIILATLFSLLSIIYFVRGLAHGNRTDALIAALFYTLAVFSKEHSVLLPLAAVMAIPLLAKNIRSTMRYAAVYLLACLPAAVTAVALLRWLIGKAYEPHFAELVAEQAGIPDLGIASGPWLVSAITQSGLFFRYLAAWLMPDTAAMSIDIRIDFLQGWSPGWILLKLVAFGAFGALGLTLLFKRGKTGLAGFGLLYFLILFIVEFSTARFQEPFVLYRSYLWAPGILIACIAALSGFSRKVALAVFIAACPVLLYQAHDRLQTFSSNLALWADAAAAEKLPSAPVPWGWRPLFNLAREQTHAGQARQAIETINHCLSRYTGSSRCYFARGAIHNYFREYEKALPDLDRALAIYPDFAVAHYQRGLALEKLGRLDEARAEYRKSFRRGYFGASRTSPEPE